MNTQLPQSFRLSVDPHLARLFPAAFSNHSSESCALATPSIGDRYNLLRHERMGHSEHVPIEALGYASRQPTCHDLSVVAQLIEAACSARDGDREATRLHISHAIALLRGTPSPGPSGTQLRSNVETQVVRGGLAAWQMRRVIAHVEANLSSRIPVQELAQLLGLSASHFCRAFKCTSRLSPRDYVLRRRIEVAQGLMLTTSEPLSSIALRCGMCDQAHFTRSFHRVVGETPCNWRRTRRGSLTID
jgi:AraC family transcriptional regulator